jgi:DNA-binding HxlR family transcriptional regulator
MAGRRLFKEFLASPEGIATNILADRLKRLELHNLVKVKETSQNAKRKSYQLTESGKALYPVLDAMATWGLTHIAGTEKMIVL